MKRIIFRFSITILTIAIGVLSVFIFNVYQEVNRSLSNSKAVINPDKGKPKIIKLPFIIDGKFMEVEIDEKEPFTFLGHACGRGYVDGYITSDEERLSSGLEKINPSKFRKEIQEASKVIENIENFKNRDGENGVRTIIQIESKGNNKQFYKIVWYDKKENMYYIIAPTLELALEFERWQESQK
ncbi:MAG: hypothetical protein M3R14_03815 [Acidobacteriota bacterium]|nr:hypothetical protein [Acidobacteriota bacterium]